MVIIIIARRVVITKMEHFPGDFNREYCAAMLIAREEELTNLTRKYFYDKIMSAVHNCDVEVVLDFDDKLWATNRAEILKELLERFTHLKVKIATGKCDVTKIVQIGSELPKNVKQIIIEFDVPRI